MVFTIAIIGRPNVGKSTLFNRLVGKKLALVHDTPGVTRDRRRSSGMLYDLSFDLIDTAGYMLSPQNRLEKQMCHQTEIAIHEADLIFFVIDARAGILPDDQDLAHLVRRTEKPVVLIANKAEGTQAEAGCLESWQLSLGSPVALSSEHALGFPDLRDAIEQAINEQTQGKKNCDASENQENTEIDKETGILKQKERPLKIAISGQPNAGKSTLINALIGEERFLVGPEAGITRDSVSIDWIWQNREIRLFDTAGIRKRSKAHEKLEKISVTDALRAINFAEVVVIVLDATLPFEKQDLRIINLVIDEGRAPVIAFSKWDLIQENRQKILTELYEKTAHALPQVAGIQAIPVSAEKKYGLEKLMQAVLSADKTWNQRLSTGPLNRWLNQVLIKHPPPAVSGRRSRIKYITQAKTRPPGFVLSCTRPEQIPPSYLRHLVNNLRESFELPGIPIRIFLRSPENPFQKKLREKN